LSLRNENSKALPRFSAPVTRYAARQLQCQNTILLREKSTPARTFDLVRLTGIVARLACALDYLPPDRATQRVFELARAESLVSSHQPLRSDPFVVKLRREAELRFARACRAYSLARGVRAGGGRS
jgi:hypothetical protein